MEILAKNLQNNRLVRPLWEILDPPLITNNHCLVRITLKPMVRIHVTVLRPLFLHIPVDKVNILRSMRQWNLPSVVTLLSSHLTFHFFIMSQRKK